MAIVRFNPMNEVLNLQREMDRLVDRFFPTTRNVDEAARSAVWSPVVDVHEDENGYTIDLELAGVNKDQVKISYQDGAVSISGERTYEYIDKAAGETEDGGANGANGDSAKGGISIDVAGRVSVEKKGPTVHRMERAYGRFHRTFNFPTAINPDAISAKFDNGMLKVVIPKAEQVKPRNISIG
ncbi:MAG: Hsp20/alpha crystallin family protein [bacterium]|nr:Hsp20/alpha crystallin family protein [Candidatus Kapabacteria bacterium]